MNSDNLMIKVVDIPDTADAAEAERLLNAPCDEGFYILNVMPVSNLPGVSQRATYKRRVRGVSRSDSPDGTA